MNKIGIMQPYFFPYIGYYQLINAVDTYVIADDLNYIKNGFVNKNFILLNGKPFKFSLQLFGASQNKLINQIEVGENGGKLLSTIKNAYKKAPQFKNVFPLLEEILLNKEKNLGKFLGHSISQVSRYMDIDTDFVYSSEIDKDNSLKFDERIYDICHRLGKDHYINAIGGQKLYDKKKFADIICANEVDYRNGAAPYYTNSSQLPVNFTDDIFETLRLQDELQTKYTGGTVLHIFLGEQVSDIEAVKSLVRKVAANYRLPYFTLTPTFSVCASHGYLEGEQPICPVCRRETEVYSRVVGYLRPVKQWNAGKQTEYADRKMFKVNGGQMEETAVDRSLPEINPPQPESRLADAV